MAYPLFGALLQRLIAQGREKVRSTRWKKVKGGADE